MSDGTGTISVKAFAAAMGVTPQAVNKAIREGRIKRAADGGIAPVTAVQEWAQNTNRPQAPGLMRPQAAAPALPGLTAPAPAGEAAAAAVVSEDEVRRSVELLEQGGIPVLAHSQAVRAAFQARQERLQYERASGALVEVATVKRVWHQRLREVRDRFLRMPAALAPELAAETDPATVRRLLDEAIQGVLVELAEEPSDG